MHAVGHWWAFVVRGAVAILFGILAFARPGMALFTLVMLFGAYALIDGVFSLVSALRPEEGRRQARWVVILEGIVGVLAGLITFFSPGLTALTLLYVIAFWSLVTGVLEIVAAVRLRREISGEWLLGLSGLLSVLFGLALLVFPGAGALAVVLWIGAYAVAFGVMLIALGFRLRKWTHTHHTPGAGFGKLEPSPQH